MKKEKKKHIMDLNTREINSNKFLFRVYLNKGNYSGIREKSTRLKSTLA